jgi:hypothetical protein
MGKKEGEEEKVSTDGHPESPASEKPRPELPY